jgi:hypothetical protein
MTDERRSRSEDYRGVRVGAAAGLTIAVIVMLVIDAISRDYSVDATILVILSTLVAGLVAVDLPDIILPGGRK